MLASRNPRSGCILASTHMARMFHVLQSPAASLPPVAPDSSRLVDADVPETLVSGPVSHTSFSSIGSQGTVLHVALPASTPLYTRRHTFLASLSSSAFTSSLVLTSILSRLRSGLVSPTPLVYQKLVTAAPINLLLNTLSPAAVISLDGRVDWVLTRAASLLAYSPFSSSLFFRPAKGLVTVTGRGILAVTGYSPFSSVFPPTHSTAAQVYKVELKDNESVLIDQASLLAYSLDAQDTRSFSHPQVESQVSSTPATSSVAAPTAASSSASSRFSAYRSSLSLYLSSFYTSLKPVVSTTTSFFKPSSNYVRVYGPSTLILSSSPNHSSSFSRIIIAPLRSLVSLSFGVSKTVWSWIAHLIQATPSPSSSSSSSSSVESQIADILLQQLNNKGAQRDNSKKGYHVVSVTNGKASFKSVNNFNELL